MPAKIGKAFGLRRAEPKVTYHMLSVLRQQRRTAYEQGQSPNKECIARSNENQAMLLSHALDICLLCLPLGICTQARQ